MDDLTLRQLELLQIIHRCINLGKSPSYIDLLRELKVKSLQTVKDILDPLERKDYINRKPNVARGIFLTHKAYRILEPNMNNNFEYKNKDSLNIGECDSSSLPRILDTQKAKELKSVDVSILSGSWVIVSQQLPEFQKHGITKFPNNTTIQKGISWESFQNRYNSSDYSMYEWTNDTMNCKIEKSIFGFGKAACGHMATIRISIQTSSTSSIYYAPFLLCEKFTKEADMAEFNFSIIQRKALPPYTGDRCLGITCSHYYNLINNF